MRGGQVKERTYEARIAARAAGIPLRRLLGWAAPERGVLRPAVRGRGKGTRRGFTVPDIVVAALLADLQQLFGRNLRPGVIATEVARFVGEHPGWLDVDGDPDPAVMLFSMRDGRLAIELQPASNVAYRVKRSGVVVSVNPERLVRRVWEVLAES